MTVRLEPWTEDDLPLVQALLGDPAMMEHLGGPEAPEKIVERHGRYVGNPGALQDRRRRRRRRLGRLLGARVAGRADLRDRLVGAARLPGPRRGASEGTRLALEAARASDGPRSVHAFPPPDNGPSNAICRKCGFTLLGEVAVRVPEGPLGAQQRLGHRPRPLTITGAAMGAGPRCARRAHHRESPGRPRATAIRRARAPGGSSAQGLMRRVPIVGAMAIDEARLEDVGSGLAPVTPGLVRGQRGRGRVGAQRGVRRPLRLREQPARPRRAPRRRAAVLHRDRLHPRGPRAGQAVGHVPRRVHAGGLPRPRRHLPAADRGSGARSCGRGTSSTSRPAPATRSSAPATAPARSS